MAKAMSQPAPQTAVDYEAAVERCLVEMRNLNEQMQQDRREIDELKVETQALKRETRALLSHMGVAL